MRVGLWVMALAVVVSAAACGPRSSAIRTSPNRYARNEGAMWLTATRVPQSAEQVGFIEAHSSGRIGIDEVMPAFVDRAADIGGNVAVVDRVQHRFQWRSSTQTYTYSCGSGKYPQTCTGTRIVNTEVATVYIQGRAFRAQGGTQ